MGCEWRQTDWRSIKDDREKYAAYLCSREWSVLKAAVHERARGRCERCEINQIDAVHHLTYARKYREDLDDLQAICNPCHEFVHGKSDFDPKPGCAALQLDASGRVLINAGGVLYDFELSAGVAMIGGTVTANLLHKVISRAEEIADAVRDEREEDARG